MRLVAEECVIETGDTTTAQRGTKEEEKREEKKMHPKREIEAFFRYH